MPSPRLSGTWFLTVPCLFRKSYTLVRECLVLCFWFTHVVLLRSIGFCSPWMLWCDCSVVFLLNRLSIFQSINTGIISTLYLPWIKLSKLSYRAKFSLCLVKIVELRFVGHRTWIHETCCRSNPASSGIYTIIQSFCVLNSHSSS